MKIVLATLVLVVAALLGLVALATFNLHVFVEAHRDELIARGQRAVGRSVTIGAVAPSWWPIGIRFDDVVVGEDPRFGTGVFLDASAVRVALRAAPLVLGRVEVARIVFDRPRITLVRDAAGRWNVVGLVDGSAPRADDTAGRDAKHHSRLRVPLVWLGLAATEIRDGRIDVEDRSGPVPRRLTAVGVRLRATELRLGGDAQVRLDAAVFPGSVRPDLHLDVSLSGLGTRDGVQTPFTGHLELTDADLETVALIAGRPPLWAGRAARVTVDATGVLDRFTVTVAARSDGEWRLGPHLPFPPMAMRIDASAEVTRDAIRLAHASGVIGSIGWTATGGATLRPWHVAMAIGGTEQAATLVVGEHPVSLTDLQCIVTGDETLRIAPAHVRLGDMLVDGEARIAGLDPLVVAGHAHATGPLGVIDVSLDADSRTGLRGRTEATGLDVGALAALWSAEGPQITGRGALSAAGSMPFGAEQPLRALTASGTARLENGSVAVVNVAAGVLRRMPAARLLPQLISSATRARFPEVFETPGTGLRSATLPFTIAAGVLTSPRLVVTADTYEITGDGTVDEAGALRFRGDLVFSPTLSAALRGDFPALRYLARQDGQLVLPFRLRGPLDNPIPEPELKRIRARDLAGLVGAGAARDLTAPGAHDRAPDDQPDVERLERMLRP